MCKAHLNSYGNCRCPCENCDNHVFAPLSRIRAHIHRYGFSSSYTNWTFHGEPFVPPAAKANLDEKTDESLAENHHPVVELRDASETSQRMYTQAEVDAMFAAQHSQLQQVQNELRIIRDERRVIREALSKAGFNIDLPSSSSQFTPTTDLARDEEHGDSNDDN